MCILCAEITNRISRSDLCNSKREALSLEACFVRSMLCESRPECGCLVASRDVPSVQGWVGAYSTQNLAES